MKSNVIVIKSDNDQIIETHNFFNINVTFAIYIINFCAIISIYFEFIWR